MDSSFNLHHAVGIGLCYNSDAFSTQFGFATCSSVARINFSGIDSIGISSGI